MSSDKHEDGRNCGFCEPGVAAEMVGSKHCLNVLEAVADEGYGLWHRRA
jgi:hypothetical protein